MNNIFSKLFLLISLSVIGGLWATPSNASEPCFSEFPDSAFVYESRPGVNNNYYSGFHPLGYFRAPWDANRIPNFRSDYVIKVQRQISKKGGEWSLANISYETYLPLFPGDRYRNTITLEGRNCAKRLINMPDLEIKIGRTPSIQEYFVARRLNFQQENEFLAKFIGPFPINFSVKEVKIGELADIVISPELQSFIQLSGQTKSGPIEFTVNFADGCARDLEGPYAGIFPSAWRTKWQAPEFVFLSTGICRAEVYSFTQDGLLFPFLIGTLDYSVSVASPTPKPSLTSKKEPITCVKGNSIRKISGTNSKCPKGFKQK